MSVNLPTVAETQQRHLRKNVIEAENGRDLEMLSKEMQSFNLKYLADQMQRYSRGEHFKYDEMQSYATGPGFPASTNVYVPSLEASGPLIVGYSRNPARFPLPRYVKYVPSTNVSGYYMKLSDQEAARVVADADFEWPDNQLRPTQGDGLEQFMLYPYVTRRRAYDFNVGTRTSNQAVWPLVKAQQDIKAAQAMTARATRMLTVATTTANWLAGSGGGDPDASVDHTATAAALVGAAVDVGTSTSPYLLNALNKIAIIIGLDTLSVVTPDQLHIIGSPGTARLLAASAEVHDFVKGSYAAEKAVKEGLGPNARYGLPPNIYGYNFVIEDTVKTTSRKGAALARSFAMPDQQLLVAGRPGELQGIEFAPQFSTLTLMYYGEDMAYEQREDWWNRIVEGSVTEDVTELLTSPISGYLLTSATAAP